MTTFPAGPDPEINNKNNYYNSSSTSSYYGFDGRSCFFHSNHQLGLMNYQVLEQQEGYDYNCCSTATRHHHRQYQAAAASSCCLVGSSSSSSDLPPPPPPPPPPQNHNHNHNRNHIDVVVVGPMADQEDDSRTETESTTVNEELTAAAAGTSTSKDKDDRMQIQIINVQDHHHRQKEIQEQEEGGWLQLSIGSSHHLENYQSPHGLVQVPRRRRSISRCEDEEEDHHQFIELDLLPPGEGEGGLTGGTASSQYSQPSPQPTIRRRSSSTLSLALPSSSSAIFHHHLPAEAEADDHPHLDYFPPPAAARPLITTSTTLSSPLFLQQYYPGPGLMGTNSSSLSFPPPPTHHPQDHINNWAFRSPNNNSIIINPTSYNNIASSSLMPPVLPSSYFMSTRPFQLLHGHGHATTSTFDFRVVDPPRRPHSGIWFMLQASHIQAKEPFLPQIPKSYLRIKDGRMTVRFIIKYLVKKLRLDSETEIEIRCRGQQLVPFLTLQHVRDSVWMMSPTSPSPSPMDTPTLTPASDHLMVLHYGRMS